MAEFTKVWTWKMGTLWPLSKYRWRTSLRRVLIPSWRALLFFFSSFSILIIRSSFIPLEYLISSHHFLLLVNKYVIRWTLAIHQQEIDLLKNLNHKNIVKYLGSLKTKTHLHIILEYAENGSFASMIKPNKFGPLPESVVAIYIAQVLEGLSYLHDQGVIHLDIKGANILMTKEGIVKLADFGVATKLTEANVNTQSAVGSPYWMAPEVIESTAKKTSDIWSVGCTVIELLTSVPPYYDLVPMSALYRIVEDPHPPIPDWLSPDVADFLRQCFQKDSALRPDAETLLQHPWILKSSRILQSSIGRNIQQQTLDSLLVDHGKEESSDGKKWKRDTYALTQAKARTADETSSEICDISNLQVRGVRPKVDIMDGPQPTTVDAEHDRKASRDLTSAIHDNPAPQSIANELSPTLDDVTRGIYKVHNQGEHEGFSIEEGNFSDAKKKSIMIDDHAGKSACHHMKIRENMPQKQDQEDVGTPASNSLMAQENDCLQAAEKLKAQMDQTWVESEQGNRDEENFLCRMMSALRGNVLDLGSVQAIDETFRVENILPAQAVEFGRLVSSLKPDASRDVIVSVCQKLIVFFRERPEQKLVFITQHGLLPLVDLLEIPDDRVICCVLQLINQLVKDNSDFLENACFIGLVPVVLNFASPYRLEDIRMQAAFFLQQLCQRSSFTLQMFVACSGLPTLVNFLEPDYAKYREMVHLAIDGIWQILKLQTCTPRNDFCRIAAKSGILIRLVNTLHSLNEATRLAPISGSWSIPANSTAPHPQSGQSDLTAAPRMDSGKLDPENQILVSKGLGWTKLPSSENIECTGTPMGGSISTTNKDRVTEANAIKQQKSAKLSSDKPRTQVELASNGSAGDNVRPLLSLLRMEPPSRHVSDHLEYLHHFSGVERHESGLPLLHVASEKKTKEELESRKEQPVGLATSTDGNCSTSAKLSGTTSSVLPGSGVQNAVPGSTESSELLFKTVATLNSDVAKYYFDKVADLLLEFALADSSVKLCMCDKSLLSRLFQMFTRIEPPILLKLLKCINHLSTDPNCLDHLQKADAIRYLIPNLEVREMTLIAEIQNEVLNALFNLCKLNKRRQEQAAENGIIPHLVHFILSDSSLKQYALSLICDMAHASHNSREQLRIHGGLDVYLSLLDDELWCVPALDSLAVCLAYDNDKKRVEQALIRKEVVQKLVNFFQCCPEQYFVNILEPFLKIITKSSRINTSLAVNGLSPLLIARLNHQDAVARLNLLKLIKAVYEHHPRPKQLIVENDLPQKLQILIEERRDGQIFGGQVLVKQLATALLKALHINTVL